MSVGGIGGATSLGRKIEGLMLDMLGLRYLLDSQEEILSGQLDKQTNLYSAEILGLAARIRRYCYRYGI